jgi:hypothetical protein
VLARAPCEAPLLPITPSLLGPGPVKSPGGWGLIDVGKGQRPGHLEWSTRSFRLLGAAPIAVCASLGLSSQARSTPGTLVTSRRAGKAPVGPVVLHRQLAKTTI